ncbi:MAG: hypothetical protein J6K24_02645 [Tidjanibacter sp.]|nr:hypothetical protein [Tidjanibacter sp.]
MERYALITEKMPREFVLLQGRGCRWRRCTYCDYYGDVSADPFEVNRPVLEQVTGRFGVLDVINSGSAMELDESTLDLLQEVVRARHIHTLWFEAHYMYRNHLADFARRFGPEVEVKFRCGVESFDGAQRERWQKGIAAEVGPEDVARHFRGVCLLVGVEGQSREQILRDIALADEHFDYYSVNLFCNNSTAVRRDLALAAWLTEELFPLLKENKKAEVLAENTDLGVG